jgi:dipeptidyl aminopeptidase/acylaminoacyl peptidase
MPPAAIRTLSLALCVIICSAGSSSQAVFPISQGRMVFHRYTSFDNYDGQLYIFDFAARTLDNISSSWMIDNSTNAHFSPDGRRIVFMGVPKGQHTSTAWDIYMWDTGSSDPPVNLTEGDGVLDQDPKFFPDGRHVAFKHAGDIAVVDIETKLVTTLTSDGAFAAKSMEYPTGDGTRILFVQGEGAASSIYSFDTTSKVITPLISDPVQNYYPIVRDDTSFLYTRWASAINKADDIYVSNYTGISHAAAFDVASSDDSDPFPVDSVLVLFSSDRSGSTGGYDIYVGNLRTGQARSLNLFGNVNTSLHELGACYTPFSAPTSVGERPARELPRTALLQVYPNPFNPRAVVWYQLPVAGNVTVSIYDMIGANITTLVDAARAPGQYSISWNAEHCASGMYICRLQGDTFSVATRIMLIR